MITLKGAEVSAKLKEQVLEMVEKLLNDTREDVLKEIAENSKETVPEMLAIIHGGGREKESGAE